ncbi:hypothetical protein [Streptomyces sp. NBC_00354]|uniref:hypothetical protein n=1 Tax=Streptomyces sp. NBC_00354 TaxID=2975723 RepID=UPI003FA74BBA
MSRTATEIGEPAEPVDPEADRPPPADDHAFGMTAGLVPYVLGRRHPAGREHSAEYALAPDVMRRAVRRIVTGLLAAGALATLLAAAGWLTMGRLADEVVSA